MSQHSLRKLTAVFLTIVSASTTGCGMTRGPKGTLLSGNVTKAAAVKAKIVKVIPFDTPVSEAQGLMERAGFNCSMEASNRMVRSFHDMATNPRMDPAKGWVGTTFYPSQFLYCHKRAHASLPIEFFFCENSWQIAFPYDQNGRVTNVFVIVGGACL